MSGVEQRLMEPTVKMMKAKLHRATVTQSDLHYEGSIGIDADLLLLSGILPNEAVHVWNINTGQRWETYAIPMPAGSGEIQCERGGCNGWRRWVTWSSSPRSRGCLRSLAMEHTPSRSFVGWEQSVDAATGSRARLTPS